MEFNHSRQRDWARSWVLSCAGQHVLIDSGLTLEALEALAANPTADPSTQRRLLEVEDLGHLTKPAAVVMVNMSLRVNPGLDPDLAWKVYFTKRPSAPVGEHLGLALLEKGMSDDVVAVASASALPTSVVDAILELNACSFAGASGKKSTTPNHLHQSAWRRAVDALLKDCEHRGLGSFDALASRVPAALLRSQWRRPDDALVRWASTGLDVEVLDALAADFTGTLGELRAVAETFSPS